jgi:hypothetical protein
MAITASLPTKRPSSSHLRRHPHPPSSSLVVDCNVFFLAPPTAIVSLSTSPSEWMTMRPRGMPGRPSCSCPYFPQQPCHCPATASPPAQQPLSSHLCHLSISPPHPSSSLVVDCNVFLLSAIVSLSTSTFPTRPQSQRLKSQGYMRLLPMMHVPRRPCTEACRRVLALLFAWWKKFPSETYCWGG